MSWTKTITCPYCKRKLPRTVKPEDIDDFGEHCDYCFLPFDVAPDGTAIGQDDPRYTRY